MFNVYKGIKAGKNPAIELQHVQLYRIALDKFLRLSLSKKSKSIIHKFLSRFNEAYKVAERHTKQYKG